MNKNQVKGKVEETKGIIKEATGKAIDNKEMQAKGKVQQTAGKVQAAAGDAKEKIKKSIN